MGLKFAFPILLPPSLLNFLAGIYAATGITLLTTLEISGADPKGPSLTDTLIDAGSWIAAAICQAWAAHIAEAVDIEVALLVDANLTNRERKDLYVDKGRKFAGRFWLLMGLTALFVSVAVAFIVIPHVSEKADVVKGGRSSASMGPPGHGAGPETTAPHQRWPNLTPSAASTMYRCGAR